MNRIRVSEDKNTHTIYIFSGPLNVTLKNKLKNKNNKIMNNSNISRNLSSLYLSKENSDETASIINSIKAINFDIQLPAVQIAFVSNNLNNNIITNSKIGTYIKTRNKNKHFTNIGNPISFGNKSGYFLRKGAGEILINYVINEMRNKGIKTIFVHPDNRKLELYYGKFGFKIIPNVPKNINRPKLLYESHGFGRLMYLKL